MNFNKSNLVQLSNDELVKVNGGLVMESMATTIGIMSGLAYLYEWGYNYAYKRTH